MRELVLLTPRSVIRPFDCGDDDLNSFLMEDAKSHFESRLAFTYILQDKIETIAYFSLLNDKILRKNSTGSSCEIIRNLFPQEIRFGSFPAVKIGRLAVSKSFQYKNIGSKLLSFIKIDLLKSPRSAFRFLTVDAYSDAVGFYERNGFVEMQPGRNGQTSIMYFDMAKLR